MNLFMLGDFLLNSGARSKWKLECDALTDGDIEALAEMIHQLVGPFGSVEGIPRGGLRLAAALQKYTCSGGFMPDPHLIVDDVLTTGGSMSRRYHEITNDAGCTVTGATAIGAVVFARGDLLTWTKALFTMPEVFWVRRDRNAAN